ncbi:MAG: hypothetical protein ABW168_03020 [Sedimenticola sp.]
MKWRLPLLAIALVLSGCASLDDRPCVVIENPYEKIGNGIIKEKVFVEGPVQIAFPLTRKINEDFRNDPAFMAGLAGGLSGAGLHGAAGAVNMHTAPAKPYSPSLGELCPTSQVVDSAYKYSIAMTDGERLTVFSSWPNHEIGECVKIFLAPNQEGQMKGRVSSGGVCN